jgi:hypothetical protein
MFDYNYKFTMFDYTYNFVDVKKSFDQYFGRLYPLFCGLIHFACVYPFLTAAASDSSIPVLLLSLSIRASLTAGKTAANRGTK